MRETLFFIPNELFGWSLFGFQGVVFWLWVVGGCAFLGWMYLKKRSIDVLWEHLPILFIVGAVFGALMPNLTEEAGLPVRGYGFMVLLGILSGVWLAGYQAKRMGLHPDRIYLLSLWFFVAGFGGARLFFVCQYWNEQFAGEGEFDLMYSLKQVVSLTNGGLVVYGAVIGAAIALVIYCHRYKLPTLAISDLIAPSLALGLGFGRLGCLMHGCCYGGVSEEIPWSIQFPPTAPPYVAQIDRGRLLGLVFGPDMEEPAVVQRVLPNSMAEEHGFRVGDEVTVVNGYKVANVSGFLTEVRRASLAEYPELVIATKADPMPRTLNTPLLSRPIHPTQVYSSVNGFLLAALLFAFYPYRTRDGEVIALLLTVYPVSRFLLEVIRSDELGQLGTSFTISQWVSVVILALIGVLWFFIRTQKPQLALPRNNPKLIDQPATQQQGAHATANHAVG